MITIMATPHMHPRGPSRFCSCFVDNPDSEYHGLQICQAIGAQPVTLHGRLERGDWLTSRWEQLEPHEQPRPPRRLYRLAPGNTAAALALLERANANGFQPQMRAPRSRPGDTVKQSRAVDSRLSLRPESREPLTPPVAIHAVDASPTFPRPSIAGQSPGTNWSRHGTH